MHKIIYFYVINHYMKYVKRRSKLRTQRVWINWSHVNNELTLEWAERWKEEGREIVQRKCITSQRYRTKYTNIEKRKTKTLNSVCFHIYWTEINRSNFICILFSFPKPSSSHKMVTMDAFDIADSQNISIIYSIKWKTPRETSSLLCLFLFF